MPGMNKYRKTRKMSMHTGAKMTGKGMPSPRASRKPMARTKAKGR